MNYPWKVVGCNMCHQCGSRFNYTNPHSVNTDMFSYCSRDCYYEDLESEVEDTGPDEDQWRFPND